MQSNIIVKWSLIAIGVAEFIISLALFYSLAKMPVPQSTMNSGKAIPVSYHGSIVKDTQANDYFRRVLFTGLKSQLVVMSIPPGGEVGAETHAYTEQTLFFLSGTGEGEFNGKKFPIAAGDVAVVVPGTEHNFWNTGSQPLKIYTVYAPPNHIDGRVHITKADSDADAADEAIGESAPVCAQ